MPTVAVYRRCRNAYGFGQRGAFPKETAMNLLHLDSSVLGAQSASRELTAAIVAGWQATHPGAAVTYRDLAARPLSHLDGPALAKADPVAAAEAERVLQEFLAADVIVVGAPMYNFSVPSQLKAWIDRIAVAGRTFRYTEAGPQGMAGGKQVVVASTRGGVHSGAASDFVEPYLRQVFGFLGIENVRFVTAEGLAFSADHRGKAMEAARAAIPLPLAEAA
jgi:FMN-dependent NADH-azoreductase